MKTKIILASTLLLSFVSTTHAALDILTEPLWDNQIKVQVVSDSSEKVDNVWFTLGYDPTLQVKSLENGNLLTNGTPVTSEWSISYSWDTSSSDIGSWVVASFILERPNGSDITESMVALEAATVNGTDVAESDLSNTSKSLSYGAVTNTTPVVMDSTSSETTSTPVSVTRSSTQTKTGAEENAVLFLGVLTLLLGWIFLKRKQF